jgi:hypothetical protein
MKTAEEWSKELGEHTEYPYDPEEPRDYPNVTVEQVKQIQLDAYRAGGLAAAGMVEELGCSNTRKGTAQAILTHFNNPNLKLPK